MVTVEAFFSNVLLPGPLGRLRWPGSVQFLPLVSNGAPLEAVRTYNSLNSHVPDGILSCLSRMRFI